MADLQCTVLSPCARFEVHFGATVGQGQEALMELRVIPHTGNAATTGEATALRTTPADATHMHARARRTARTPRYHYKATLNEAQVAELTSSAGVRKSFRNFAEMTYNGLMGTAKCVRFFIETVDEMKQRITRDIREKREQQLQQPTALSATQSAAVAVGTVNEDTSAIDGETSHSLVHLSLHSDTAATQALVERFLTIDYDVDFTRAVFPIPLSFVEDEAAVVEEQVIALSGSDGEEAPPGRTAHTGLPSGPAAPASMSHRAGRRDGGDEETVQLRAQLAEMRAALTDLGARNKKLEQENHALQSVCKEKMLAMQRLCERFQDHAELVAEVQRLKRKNTELRLRMRAAEESHTEVEKRLLHTMTFTQRSPQQRVPRRDGREASPSPRPAAARTHRLASSSPSREAAIRGTGTRGRAAEPGQYRVGNERRGPLVSPTPPPRSARSRDPDTPTQRAQLRWGEATATRRPQRSGNRFDTPPSAAPVRGGSQTRTQPRRTSRAANRFDSDLDEEADDIMGGSRYNGVDVEGGGDARAPRGRTGDRPSLSRSPSWPRDARSRSGSIVSARKETIATRGRSADFRRADTHSRCSSVSSRGSSTVSERLYHATTVSSRQRQDAVLEEAMHRDPGRLDYQQQERYTPSRRRSVFR